MRYLYYLIIILSTFSCKEENKPITADTKTTETEPIIQDTTIKKTRTPPIEVSKDDCIKTMQQKRHHYKLSIKDTVTVNDSQSLINNIKSHTLIRLTSTTYMLDKALYLNDITDLILEGRSQTKILGTNGAQNVMTINNSKDISLKNIFLGHHIEPKQNCESGVLILKNSQNILIDATTLDGSGDYGLNSTNTTPVFFTNSTIQKCTSMIASCINSSILFENSIFQDNYCHDTCFSLNCGEGNCIYFNNCKIINNNGESDDEAGLQMFSVYKHRIVIDSTIFDNKTHFGINNKIEIN